MSVRWITDRLGTAPWSEDLGHAGTAIVDVRLLRDGAGNSSDVVLGKIEEAAGGLARGETVVVCCDYGISRSNVIAAATLSQTTGIGLEAGLRQVVRTTGETGIKIDFVEDLRGILGSRPAAAEFDRVLILGAEGFIGQGVSRDIGPSAIIPDTESDEALISNPVLLDAVLVANRAGRILLCWHPPSLDTNRAVGELVAGLRNVLEVCRVRRAGLVFVSGQQVFAGLEDSEQPCDEETPPSPAGAAGDGLFLAETLIRRYAERHILDTLIVRVPHVYGPGDDRPGTLRTLASKALAGQPIVTHRYRGCAPAMDLLHVRDLARALRSALEQGLTGMLHLGSGHPIRTDELARLITKITASESTLSTIELPGKAQPHGSYLESRMTGSAGAPRSI